jgi:ubiquinone/menaquinone biosynthesis C-methylase UbiE
MSTVNAQYNVAAPNSLSSRLAGYQRRRMYARFLAQCKPQPGDSIVDVGATSDRSYDHSNYLEAWYPHKSRITAVGVDDASFLEQLYPGMVYRKADGRALPFADRSFDFAHSSAVIEHVGSRENQAKLLSELWRVARKGIFVTTPNRWFPVEFHSVLPLVHWLPAPAFRAILRSYGLPSLAEEANLNLMSRNNLRTAAREAGLTNVQVCAARLGGWTSNLLLVARRQ